jgi:diacylglycerol kinase (ATP)
MRWRCFADAARGLGHVLASQANARIHAAATFTVVAIAFWLRLSALEWALIAAAIALVWTAEAINTAIECTVDLASPQRHPLAGRAKDAAAGAVLAAALGAALIGALVLGPKLAEKARRSPDAPSAERKSARP